MQGCGCYITLMFANLVLIFTSVSLSSARPYGGSYKANGDDKPLLTTPHRSDEKLDNLYEAFGRLLWKDTEESNRLPQRPFPLNSKRTTKHDLSLDVVSRLEDIVQNLKEINRWNNYVENNLMKTSNPAGSGSSYPDGEKRPFVLNKRSLDNANVVMCLLCSQNTYVCDAQQLVIACYGEITGN